MATGITDAVLDDIKARIDLADLVASYGINVVSAGASKKACCPFHNEKTPSFNINENRGFYHCFGCGESGDAIKFVQKMEGLTFVEAVKKLAEQCGVKIEEKVDPEAGRRQRLYALMAEIAQFYHRCLLKTREAQIARDYLQKRDLGPDVQESFLIGYAPNGIAPILKWAEKYGYSPAELAEAGVVKPPDSPSDKGFHRFGGRLMFSIRDKRGRVVAFSGRQLVENKRSGKYVNSPETPIFKKSNVLFGFDKAAGNIAKSAHHEVIVCEGQIDTIRLHVSGFPVAVASQGTAFTAEHARMVKKVADQVVLVFDDDAAGHKATVRTAGLFLAEEMPVRVVSLPNGDDPDSFLRTHPREEFQALLDNAESIMSFQVRTERAKERDPQTVDAMNRVVRAVLQTIAASKSAVIRAGMVGEAAKILGLPAIALQEELGKVRLEPVRAAPPRDEGAEEAEEAGGDPAEAEGAEGNETREALAGEDAAAAIPPTTLETSFMAFLMDNEYDAKFDGVIGEFLPGKVFAHDFTRRFVEVWRAECVENRDLISAFSEGLSARDRAWLGAVLKKTGLTEACNLSPVENLRTFVTRLWIAELKRRQGALPVLGTHESVAERMKLSKDVKKFESQEWEKTKAMIREFLAGEDV